MGKTADKAWSWFKTTAFSSDYFVTEIKKVLVGGTGNIGGIEFWKLILLGLLCKSSEEYEEYKSAINKGNNKSYWLTVGFYLSTVSPINFGSKAGFTIKKDSSGDSSKDVKVGCWTALICGLGIWYLFGKKSVFKL